MAHGAEGRLEAYHQSTARGEYDAARGAAAMQVSRKSDEREGAHRGHEGRELQKADPALHVHQGAVDCRGVVRAADQDVQREGRVQHHAQLRGHGQRRHHVEDLDHGFLVVGEVVGLERIQRDPGNGGQHQAGYEAAGGEERGQPVVDLLPRRAEQRRGLRVQEPGGLLAKGVVEGVDRLLEDRLVGRRPGRQAMVPRPSLRLVAAEPLVHRRGLFRSQ